MQIRKSFTLKEAKLLIPEIRELLININARLDDYIYKIDNLKLQYYKIANETGIENIKLSSSRFDLNYLDQEKLKDLFDEIKFYENISKAEVIEVVENIMDRGIILRDLRTGLLDFPAFDQNLLYYLCWRIEEDDIHWWHTRNESFINRKPIASLIEFI